MLLPSIDVAQPAPGSPAPPPYTGPPGASPPAATDSRLTCCSDDVPADFNKLGSCFSCSACKNVYQVSKSRRRFHCKVCDDFDFCHTCIHRIPHDTSHGFVMLSPDKAYQLPIVYPPANFVDMSGVDAASASASASADEVTSSPGMAGFDAFLASVKAESFSSGKISKIEMVAKNNMFNATQAGLLLDAMDFDKDKITVAVLLYPQLTNQANFYQVLDHLDFSSSKDEVRNQLGL